MRTWLPLLTLPAVAAAAVLLAVAPSAGGAEGSSATLTVRNSPYGRVVWDGQNRALYAFTRDPRGRSTCYGACAAAWPPYIARGALRAGAGVKRSLLGTTRRRDGSRQLTYAGRPLYYYVSDPVGEIRCQNVYGFGGLWLVVRPDGRIVR